MIDEYLNYLKRKVRSSTPAGFEPVSPLNSRLFDWQRPVVMQALRIGRYALFEERGLGKTIQQVEWAKHVEMHTGKPVLIVCPLAVAKQTIREGKKLDVEIKYIRNMDDANMATGQVPVMIINYDMLKHIEPQRFGGVVLDESSILKNYTGKTKRFIVEYFVPTIDYRLFCSATPAPNDHLELGNHSEGLGVLSSNEMISRYFENKTMDKEDMMVAGKYQLHPHARVHFWKWLTSWAAIISKPSDIGFSDEGYIRPPLKVVNHLLGVDHTRAWSKGTAKRNGQARLFLDDTLSVIDMWAEKRQTYEERCRKAKEIDEGLAAQNEYHIIWCDTNDESNLLSKLIPDAVEVRGSDSLANKEAKLDDFTLGNVRAIVTKSKIAGMGLNWQHCANQTFASVNYKWEEWYQAVGRTDRFGNDRQTQVNMIFTETEGKILEAHRRKGNSHAMAQDEVNKIFAKFGSFISDQSKINLDLGEKKMELPQWLK